MLNELATSLSGLYQHPKYQSHASYRDVQRICISPRVLRVTLNFRCCEGILTLEQYLDVHGPLPPSLLRELGAMYI